jgi:uncharacterized protein
MTRMPPWVWVVAGLAASNVFMTLAWYGHLQGDMKQKPWVIAALVAWGVALLEYLIQVPTNRYGSGHFSVSQLKIIQEAVSLTVFVPIAVLYLREPLKRDYLYASACILAAVYFMFRGKS